MKTLMLALAAVTLFVTTTALPSLADGNPMPICTKNGCTKPVPQNASVQSWQQFYVWIAGNTPNGTELLVVWDSSQTCTVVGCTYSSYTVPSGPGYTQYYTLGAQAGSPLGSAVNIGCYPILLSQ